jgi:hypothetical protein
MVFQYRLQNQVNMKMKGGFRSVVLAHVVFAFIATGCQRSDAVKKIPLLPEKVLEQSSGAVIQLFRDTVYLITTDITVNAGQRMVIDPGTLIKFGSEAAPNRGSLTISQDATLIANGNAQQPVVFTSVRRAGSQTSNWQGITIRGRSFNNSRGNTGIADDNSGSLQYVRIEFARLVLDGVGNRTTINNVMVSYASGNNSAGQPAIEIDGGTFNARNLVTYACGGSADIYITQGYTGRLQNVLTIRHPFFGKRGFPPTNSISGVYIENNASNPKNARPYTFPVISNLTVIGPNDLPGTAADFFDTTYRFQNGALVTTKSTCFRIRNSVFCGFHSSAWFMDDFETADNYRAGISELRYSVLHAGLPNRVFYLDPNTFPPFGSSDFQNFALAPAYHDAVVSSVDLLKFTDPFQFDKGPNPLPALGSRLLTGADFSGADFSNQFFQQVPYIGAIGSDNWLRGWTNFIPLKTNYNFPD